MGEVLQGQTVGEVAASRHPDFQEGELVTGMLGWESYSLSDGRGLRKLERTPLPLHYYLSVLGTTGLTAYVGLLDIGHAKAGETVFVSAASGAVGSVVGQIAKLEGCRVVGSTGSDEKVRTLTEELGFDAAINYKTDNLREALKTHCPKGIDIDFENVGGDTLEAALGHMNDFGRIVACGMIAHYNDDTPRPGPRNMPLIVMRRLTMQGFIVSDHVDRLPEFVRVMSGWLQDGKVKHRETVTEGLEHAPDAFIKMLAGDKVGKQIVRVGEDSV